MAAARYAGYEYLALGEMMRPATITGTMPKIAAPWHPATKYDGIETSSWKGMDGSAALVFVNVTESPHDITWQISPDMLGMSGKSEIFTMTPLYPEGAFGQRRISLAEDGSLSSVASVAARDALIVKITPE